MGNATFRLFHVASNRLVTAATGTANELWFSELNKPHDFDNQFNTDNFHRISGGEAITGLASLGQIFMIFTTGGVWTLRGLPFDIVDALGNPQQTLEKLSDDLVLWGEDAGLASWEQMLIVPCQNGVYLIDGISSPMLISRSIEPLYTEYVEGGYRPGGAAVYQGYYMLPILDSNGAVQDLLFCRLTRQALDRRRRTSFPWVRAEGQGAEMSAFFATRPGLDTTGAAIRASGPRVSGTQVDDASNGASEQWFDLADVNASDDQYAGAFGLENNSRSHYLKLTNFGFSIPTGAAISGIKVEIERKHEAHPPEKGRMRVSRQYKMTK